MNGTGLSKQNSAGSARSFRMGERESFKASSRRLQEAAEEDAEREAEETAFSWSNPNLTTRQKIWIVMNYPGSSRAARIWSTLVMITIIISSASFVIGSLARFQADKHPAFGIIELVCVIIFTVEYIFRLATSPSRKDGPETLKVYAKSRFHFMIKPMNVVDLVAILPFYVELLVAAFVDGERGDASALAVVRVVRITRVFRLLKLGKHNEGLDILKVTMQESWSFLVSVLFLVVIFQVLFGALIYYAESGSVCVEAWQCRNGPDEGQDCTSLVYSDGHMASFNGSVAVGKRGSSQPNQAQAVPVFSQGNSAVCANECQSVGNICFGADGSLTNFNSIPIAMWWALVTMCCVGFGDIAPATPLGQLIGAVAAITGVIVLAMPTTVIGTNFSEAYYAKRGDEEEEDGDEMPAELKGANSNKNLNRLIVQKQLAATNKKAGIPDTVLEAAFSKGSSSKNERERRDDMVLAVFDDHRRVFESQEEWAILQSRALAHSKADLQKLMARSMATGSLSAQTAPGPGPAPSSSSLPSQARPGGQALSSPLATPVDQPRPGAVAASAEAEPGMPTVAEGSAHVTSSGSVDAVTVAPSQPP